MESQAPPPELLIEVSEGLITNKFQGGLGAGGLGTILFRNTNPMKLMLWESSNFSSLSEMNTPTPQNSWESNMH